MATYEGRSGTDAIFKALNRVCLVIKRYSPKIQAAINTAVAAGVITSSDATTAIAFVAGATVLCDIFRAVAGNSGF